MSKTLSTIDREILQTLLRVRGLMPDTEALRKRMSRLVEAGFLAASKIPNGRLIYRLSHKGVRVVDAPTSFATSPTPAICAEMISKSSVRLREEFWFLTKLELRTLLSELDKDNPAPALPGSFFLRQVTPSENHLHFWLCELRPTDELCKRMDVIIEKLGRWRSFAELIETKLFGFTVIVPSVAAKQSLEAKSFRVEPVVEVCEALQSIITLQ